MAEVFIEEWRKKDFDGRRDKKTRSDEKINGEYAYGCQGLTSWFRLGKYIIKHDQANFLLGLIREIGTDNVRTWECEETETGYKWGYNIHFSLFTFHLEIQSPADGLNGKRHKMYSGPRHWEW